MADQNKKIALTITANTRQLRQDMRRATGEVKAFETQVQGLGAKMRAMRMRFQSTGIFGRGGGMLRGAAGFAGVFGFAQMIQGAKEGNAALTDIAITGNLTNKEMEALKKTMYEVSNATGKSTTELGQFVATVTTMTGDAKGAASVLGQMSEVMVATGASGEALAGTYVKLTTTMGLLPKQAKEAFNVLRSQEKLGSVTMANIAQNFGKVIGAAGVFGAEGKGIKGVKTLGGLYQIAQRGFAVGQEGEAATSAGSFLRFLGQRAKTVEKEFGVQVFDKSGKARDLPTVLEELGVAFNKKGEKFRTKGALIFGRSGIRTANQLKEAMAGGAGKAVGSFASFNALVREAGGTDVIKSDAARRRQSAAYQFDSSLNILKNTLKKPMSDLFKELAKGMKEWGPDLVRVLKFLIENSRGLFKLWLGYKGMTFFRNLMAPVGGGQVAGALAGGGGMMLPGGQMVAARGMPGTAYASPIGPMMPLTLGQRAMGGFVGAMPAMGRGLGMAAGAANAMGLFGSGKGGVLGQTGSMISTMGLMSGNPALMAAAVAALLVNDTSIDVKRAMSGKDSRMTEYARKQAYAFGGSSANLDKVAAGAMADYNKTIIAQSTLSMMRNGTIEAVQHQQRVGELLPQLGIGGPGGSFIFNKGVVGAQGIAGVKTMRGKLGREVGIERQLAIAAARAAGKGTSEEELRKVSPEYARMADLMGNVEKLLADMASGKLINVNAIVNMPDGTPASRLGKNATGGNSVNEGTGSAITAAQGLIGW